MIADVAGSLKATDMEWPLHSGPLDRASTDDILIFEGSTCHLYHLNCLTWYLERRSDVNERFFIDSLATIGSFLFNYPDLRHSGDKTKPSRERRSQLLLYISRMCAISHFAPHPPFSLIDFPLSRPIKGGLNVLSLVVQRALQSKHETRKCWKIVPLNGRIPH